MIFQNQKERFHFWLHGSFETRTHAIWSGKHARTPDCAVNMQSKQLPDIRLTGATSSGACQLCVAGSYSSAAGRPLVTRRMDGTKLPMAFHIGYIQFPCLGGVFGHLTTGQYLWHPALEWQGPECRETEAAVHGALSVAAAWTWHLSDLSMFLCDCLPVLFEFIFQWCLGCSANKFDSRSCLQVPSAHPCAAHAREGRSHQHPV